MNEKFENSLILELIGTKTRKPKLKLTFIFN